LPADRVTALAESFGVLAGILMVAGWIEAWRRVRWFFWFSVLLVGFAGPVFAAYANMNLSTPLSRYVLERFFLLPQVLAAPVIALGVLLAARWRVWVSAAVFAAVAVTVAGNYRELDQSRNHTARYFAEDIFATLDRGSIIVVNGDEVIMPLAYLQDAERYRPDVAIVVMPFLFTDWYVPQLRRQYPWLVVPFEKYDGKTGTIRALMEANPGHRVAVDGVSSEAALNQNYWFYRRGLVDELEPMTRDVKLDELISENESLLRHYRVPAPGSIKAQSLEPTVLTHYATPMFTVAQQCRQLNYLAQAKSWYERTLAVDPSVISAHQALDEIGGAEAPRRLKPAPH
jgi:hypothetical protein